MRYQLFLIYILFFQFSLGQEIPPLKAFTPNVYNSDNQNWGVSQDKFGYIYIANNAGLLEYNGSKWSLTYTPNASIMRSVNAIDNRVYVGYYMGFGYYQKDSRGNLIYTSLSELIEDEILEDEQFWQIEKFKNWILFRSLNRIYLYNTSTESFQFYTASNIINQLSIIEDVIYYHVSNEGIYTLKEGRQELFLSNSVLKENALVGFYEAQGGFIAVTDQAGVYKISNTSISPLNQQLNSLLKANTIYTSIQLSDERLAIGTISNGLFIIDTQGRIQYEITQEMGLTNNTILDLFEANDKSLWLGTDYGVNYINLGSSIKIFNDPKGKIGTVYSAMKYGDDMYLGTNQGLFYMPKGAKSYQLVPGTSGQVWTLFEYDSTLFCGHNSGSFIIYKNTATKIADIAGAWTFKPLENHPNTLLQGNYNGIHVLKKINDKWQYSNKIKGFDYSSRFIEIINNTLLVNHEYKGVFELEVNKDYTQFIKAKKIDSFYQNQASAITSYKNNIYYASKQGFYEFDKQQMQFQRKDSTSKHIASDFVSGLMNVNEDGIWLFGKNNIINLKQGQVSKSLAFKKIPFPINIFSSQKGFEALIKINENNYLIGSSNGYAMVTLNDLKQVSFEVLLDQVTSINSQKQAIKALNIINDDSLLEHDNNSITFSFSAPYYSAIQRVQYQTRLLGRSESWSNWSDDTTISFENLPSGDYSFELKAKAGNQLSNNVISYPFIINKPWYASNLAIAFYIVVFLFLAFMVNTSYQRYFKKQRKELLKRGQRKLDLQELKANKKISDIEKGQLQQDVENKNRELGIATMSMIKKNEFLASLKKMLKEENKDAAVINKVIKKIDRNLSDANDWKYFEEAFNNADKDFLKKIKKIHPNLTPNDLRLCAYLRLNLSSKEVAPLLNISPRSVEIKRYRLRKKMELTHEQSLVEHILAI
jgi:DNA-binding CsgD family transcriptional regulator